MSELIGEKDTIRIVLGLIFPGAGHIYLGNKRERIRGIKIAIVFVIVNYLQNSVLNLLPFGEMSSRLGIMFIPIVVIWVWQIFDLIKIAEKRSTSNNNHDVVDIKSKA